LHPSLDVKGSHFLLFLARAGSFAMFSRASAWRSGPRLGLRLAHQSRHHPAKQVITIARGMASSSPRDPSDPSVASETAEPQANLSLPPPRPWTYDTYVVTTPMQRLVLSGFSAFAAFADPKQGDMVAVQPPHTTPTLARTQPA
jgi:hypothetical protein